VRKLFFITCVGLVLCGCHSNGKSADADQSPESDGSLGLVWQVDYDNKTMTRNPMFRDEDLNVDSMLSRLNRAYPKIQLQQLRLGSDTLYLEIKEAYELTEAMGTYGANSYIADAVINLTSVNGIAFVNIYFRDGTHLSHGTWGKKEFSEFKAG